MRGRRERARSFGASGLPFFAIGERYGVSGAQPPEAYLEMFPEALHRAAG